MSRVIKRREFLQQAGLSIGVLSGVASPGLAVQDGPAKDEPRPRFRPDDWASVREQFPLTRSYVHLATFFLASHPRCVADAVERYRKGLDENPVDYWHSQFEQADARTRAAAADYLGGSADHIALTDCTTMGLGLVYGGLRLEPGQEIVSTTHDHYSTQVSLSHRAERTGATVREISLYESPARASVDEIVSRMRAGISDRTRVLAVTWVHSCTGVKLPLAAMATALRNINASRDPEDQVLFCVDGVHGLGIEDVKIAELGCDFFVAGTHKWMFGPRGTGLIWGRPEAWKVVRPVIPSFGLNYGVWLGKLAPDQVPIGDLLTPGGFHSFEHRWALPEAFRFHLEIGKARIQERIHGLNTMAKEAMAGISHIKVHTPLCPKLSAGIICFDVAGRSPEEVVDYLRGRGIIASTSPYRTSYARIAPSLINDEEEIDRTMAALRAMA